MFIVSGCLQCKMCKEQFPMGEYMPKLKYPNLDPEKVGPNC